MMNSSRLTSSARFIRLVWIWKMRRLVFSSGSGNLILRSIRPGRIEGLNLIGGHDDLDVGAAVKTVELVEKTKRR